jgi:hypothetical protein
VQPHRFAPTATLDPLRYVVAPSNKRYDVPDVDALDACVRWLRRRSENARTKGFPNLARYYEADIDTLLERRQWLTLPVTES